MGLFHHLLIFQKLEELQFLGLCFEVGPSMDYGLGYQVKEFNLGLENVWVSPVHINELRADPIRSEGTVGLVFSRSFQVLIKEDTMKVMTKLILKECKEKARVESNLAKPKTDNDTNIELSWEFLMELQRNAYYEMFDEDVVDHIAKVLKILDLIKIPNVDTYRLRMKVSSLTG
ncbi:hypothetical protein Tco_0464358 [Tanacetum coccineum]